MYQEPNIYYACPEEDGTFYDVYELFQYYDAHFFNGELEKCTVRWTKRMTQCAGTCKYEGFGSSTISLSEPLLKFRTSNQLKQTLIHEMIHAYLFKTNPKACQSQGGHGPAFVEIMNKINRITGLKITIYHSFHAEVNFYRQHVWRCNGRCRDQPPFYGEVKRSMNRPPQPADYWFAQHRRHCGGQFIKISEPEKKKSKQKDNKKPKRSKKILDQKDLKKWGFGKTIQDYWKEMQKDSKNKKKTKKGSQNSSVSQSEVVQSQIKPFSGSGKSIADYCLEIQKEKQKNNENKRIPDKNQQK